MKTHNRLNYVFSGRTTSGSRPYSMSYAGHQFGNWAGQWEMAELFILEVKTKEQVYTYN
jgi:uncharacterized protein YdiU (UPF0061 family)